LSELFELGDDSVEILDLGGDCIEVGLRKVYAFEERESVSDFIFVFHVVLSSDPRIQRGATFNSLVKPRSGS
jgi:hypothetical protein